MNKKTKENAIEKAKSLHYTLNTIKDQVWNTNSFLDYSFKRLGWFSDFFKWTGTMVFLVITLIISWCLWFIARSLEVFFCFLFLILIIFVIIKSIFIINKDTKIRKLKQSWKWIVKHLKITWIENFIKSWDEYSDDEKFFYIKVIDWNKVLYSTPYSKWELKWVSKENLKNIYWMYWYEYDDKETHKQDVLTKIDRSILNAENNSKNSSDIKKTIINWKIKASKDLRTIVEKWYTQLYREVNWKKIKIWDNVDVYFDSKNPEYYRIDLDYLFEK